MKQQVVNPPRGRNGSSAPQPRKEEGRATACKACRDRKQKCIRSAAINDVCGQCTMRNEPCIWPPNSLPRAEYDTAPQAGTRRQQELHAATSEIVRLQKLVVLLEDRLTDNRPMRRAPAYPPWHGPYPPPGQGGRPHSHFYPHHHLPPPPPSPHELYPPPSGFGAIPSPPPPSHLHPAFHPPPQEPTVLQGAEALVSLSNSPISAHSAHPTSGSRHEGYPDYPTPHSAVNPPGPPPFTEHPPSAPLMDRPPTPSTSRGSPHGPVRLPSLRLSIPSTSPSPGPMSSARTSALSSAHPFALSPIRRGHHLTPLGPPHLHLHSPFSHRSPSLAGPDRRHVFLSPSVNSPASALDQHRPPYPPLLYFVSIPAEGASAEEWESEQAQRETYKREMATPMKRREAREAHERRYDAAVAEMMRGRKGKARAEEGREEGSGEGEASESGNREGRKDQGGAPQRPVLLGALRAGSGDTMLGGMAPSPIDRLISPAKERAESRLGEEMVLGGEDSSLRGGDDGIGEGKSTDGDSAEGKEGSAGLGDEPMDI